jgi:hypothetical protein
MREDWLSSGSGSQKAVSTGRLSVTPITTTAGRGLSDRLHEQEIVSFRDPDGELLEMKIHRLKAIFIVVGRVGDGRAVDRDAQLRFPRGATDLIVEAADAVDIFGGPSCTVGKKGSGTTTLQPSSLRAGGIATAWS